MTGPPGVTGKRSLTELQESAVRIKLQWLLQFVRDEVARLADDPRARAAYRGGTDRVVPAVLQFLSPLAEGADRLAAKVAVSLDYALHVPMPFKQAKYEQDFCADPSGTSRTPRQGSANFYRQRRHGWHSTADALPPATAATTKRSPMRRSGVTWSATPIC